MSATDDHRDDRALAGEYALGLLPEDEQAAFEARLAAEPELRAQVRAWTEELVHLADEIDPVTPPAHVEKGIEARLFDDDQMSLGRFFRNWFGSGLVVAGLAALIIFGTDVLERGPQMPSDPALVAEIAAEDRSLVVQAAFDADTGALFVQAQQGRARDGRVLELWLIEGGNAPVSLGVLSADGPTWVALSDTQRAVLTGAVLAISDEPPGGSPTGAPTGDVLGVGEITNV
ncbi:MAG: anti-sigma factor [Roseovarius sp.]